MTSCPYPEAYDIWHREQQRNMKRTLVHIVEYAVLAVCFACLFVIYWSEKYLEKTVDRRTRGLDNF